MPAKITTSTTDNQSGEISISDVHKMLTDFRTKVEVSCTDPSRNPIVKRFHFDIDLDRISELMKGNTADKKKFRIFMSLNLPGQLNCHNSGSVENHLSLIISGVNKNDKTPLLNLGSPILVDGFKDHTDFAIKGSPDDVCCVQGSPIPM